MNIQNEVLHADGSQTEILNLTAFAGQAPKFKVLKSDRIVADKDLNYRDLTDYDPKNKTFKPLIESMKLQGWLPTLPAVVSLQENGTYRLLIGHRRFYAATEAGIVDIPCLVMTGLTSAQEALYMVDHAQRKDLDEIGYFKAVRRLTYEGYGRPAIAKHLGKEVGWVQARQELARLPLYIQDAWFKSVKHDAKNDPPLELKVLTSNIRDLSKAQKADRDAGEDDLNVGGPELQAKVAALKGGTPIKAQGFTPTRLSGFGNDPRNHVKLRELFQILAGEKGNFQTACEAINEALKAYYGGVVNKDEAPIVDSIGTDAKVNSAAEHVSV